MQMVVKYHFKFCLCSAVGNSQLAGFRFIGDDKSTSKKDQKAGNLWTEAKSISLEQHILVFMMLKDKVKLLYEVEINSAWKKLKLVS